MIAINLCSGVNGFIYVLRKGRIDDIDKNVINVLQTSYGDLFRKNAALVITGMEDYLITGENSTKWLLKQQQWFQDVTKIFEKGVYFCCSNKLLSANFTSKYLEIKLQLQDVTGCFDQKIESEMFEKLSKAIITGNEKQINEEINAIYSNVKWYETTLMLIPFINLITIPGFALWRHKKTKKIIKKYKKLGLNIKTITKE